MLVKNKIKYLEFFLFFLACALVIVMLGPSINDYADEIENGYYFNDAGHYEKSIIYLGDDREHQIIIDARVDDYFVENGDIIVARRPRMVRKINNVVKSSLSSECEYWTIDTKNHTVNTLGESLKVHCSPITN